MKDKCVYLSGLSSHFSEQFELEVIWLRYKQHALYANSPSICTQLHSQLEESETKSIYNRIITCDAKNTPFQDTSPFSSGWKIAMRCAVCGPNDQL